MPMSPRPAQSCDVAALADLARGLVSDDLRPGLDAHLADCAACRNDLAALTRLARVATADAGEMPGRAAMQRALAIFATPADARLSLPRWLGNLVGGAEPALAGLRAATAHERQGEFRAGPYRATLRVDVDPRDTSCAIVGQIDGPADRAVAGLPVLVTVGTRVLQQAETNQHGEFECVCEAVPQLRVQVVVDGGTHRVELPLARFFEEPQS